MKNSFVTLLIVLFLQPLFLFNFGQEKSQHPSYHIKVRIDPAAGLLKCKTEIMNPSDSIFTLNKDMEIQRIIADGKNISFNKSDSGKAPNTSEYAIVSSIPKNVTIEYSGKIKGESFQPIVRIVNMIKPELIELASYVSWYPKLKHRGSFSYKMDINLPSNFVSLTNGYLKKEETDGDRKLMEWESYGVCSDIVILAAPDLKKSVINDNGNTIEIYYSKLPETYIDSMKSSLLKSMDWLTRLLGTPESNELVRVGYSPRPAWGYVRTPFIIVSEENALWGRGQKFGFERDFRYTTHEIAHYWWNMANTSTPDDWINEGLAEYSAFLASEDIMGKEFADQLLNEYMDHAKNSMTNTTIAETENNSQDREVNRYAKPVLIFNEARDKFGNENMNRFYKYLYDRFKESKGATTEIFLNEVEKKLGEKAKEFFIEALYKRKWNSDVQVTDNSYSEADSIFLGTWSGILTQMGMKMKVVLHINEKDGVINAVMESSDQGVKDIPVSEVKIDGDLLFFKLNAAGVNFNGTLNLSSTIISGNWNQSGNDFPLILKKE